ncbi:MAG: sigma-70 family RNA polymerase sigma factor [Akkermansiaceae bacterium]|nr:sigma-70 family RNA polymerase sigma factor [Verrucomicrobiales bacterium]
MEPTVEDIQVQLLRRIAAKDRQALADFYDQTAKPLFSLACRILGDTSEAEEVIQDVFVQIWEKASTFDPAAGLPFHWAIRIARNRAIDRVRARQRRARVIDEFHDTEILLAVPAATNDQPALADQEIGVIHSAVSALPKDQRQAIEMAFFSGMTHPEIATALSEPLGTIKARIRRGMLKLRDTLQPFV